jgi:ABC-type branched-subunit amino acid transport system ATPase component/predicted MFS family arabinose efflux permease
VTDEGLAGLAGAVLDDEPGAEEPGRARPVVASAPPGSGEGEMTLAEGLRAGGPKAFWVLLALGAIDNLESSGLSVLAPDIRDSFGLSDGAITLLTAAAGAFIALGAVPMGWLADRVRRRGPMIGLAGIGFGLAVFASGLAPNAFAFFCARFGAGIATSTSLPVHGSFLADTYPIGVRGRISATTALVGRVLAAVSPLLVGGIAAAGGDEGWRWPFLVLSLPVAVVSLWALVLREPVRGRWEKQDVLGSADPGSDEAPAPISMEAAFARLGRIRTLRTVILGFSALGFGILMVPVLSNLYIEDRFGTGTVGRGAVTTASGLAGLVVLPFVGRWYDRTYRDDPARAVRLVGLLVLPVAVLAPIQYAMPNIVLFAVVGMVPAALLVAAFILIGPLIQSVVPYRLRGLGLSLTAIYLFCIGATGGAIVTLPLTNSFGPRTSILAVLIPSTIVGGLLIVRSAAFVHDDLALLVDELAEERAELDRQAADPAAVPALQVSGIDFSYGPVQVLFDVGFEVRKGEVLALLGTNGAGKSTILDVVTGLQTPSRGVVRHHGRTITFTSPEQRAARGIHSLAGGRATFPALTVADNLEVAGILLRHDRAAARAARERVLDLFPDVRARLDQRAGSLSGGQQQQLGLAMTLLHEPDVLIVDELSLGLSPVMVADLLAVVDRLRAVGQTMVIVEQSLNVALAVSDRAVFLEKGQVRFEGPSAELAARDDLARAVFLGAEGGG